MVFYSLVEFFAGGAAPAVCSLLVVFIGISLVKFFTRRRVHGATGSSIVECFGIIIASSGQY